ncbi:MAG: substrate-binding domain-containing protein [Roseiarcus sp.]
MTHMVNFSKSLSLAALLAPLLLAGSGANSEGFDYFKGKIAPFTKKPEFVAPGPAFDAVDCAKGKTIFSIPHSSANPFTANIEKAMAAAAKKIGLGFTVWENQANRSEYVQGMNTALNQKASLIDLLAGPDPRALVPQVKAAADAGIPTVASHFNGYEQSAEVAKFAAGEAPIDYFTAGSLLVDWAAAKTDGKLNALIVTAPGPLSSDSTLAGMKAELAKCEGCKSKVLEFPDSWASKITPGVQSALLADPSINYIVVMYDPMTQFVVPAVTITGSKVKVDGFNGTPFAIGLVQQGKVDMILGENLDWIGYAIVDSELRRICGKPPVADPKIPLYIFDSSNAADAGTPPQLSQGYGDAYVDGYAKLWQLK